jgi:hypothetical protein
MYSIQYQISYFAYKTYKSVSSDFFIMKIPKKKALTSGIKQFKFKHSLTDHFNVPRKAEAKY